MQELFALIDRHTLGDKTPRTTIGFSLENGAAQLQPWFDPVARVDFPNGLEVTEVEPLVAYVLSTTAAERFDAAGLAALRAEAEQTIASTGAFHVTKAVGLFTGAVPVQESPG